MNSRTRISISFADHDTAVVNTKRIAGCVARTEDDVYNRGRRVIVETSAPGAFVTAYIEDGYDEPLSIQP